MKKWLLAGFAPRDFDELFDPTADDHRPVSRHEDKRTAGSEREEPAGAVVLRHIEKRFGTPAGEHVVLRDMNLDIPAGQFIAFLGPSGCGKSTLLNIVSGITSPDGGEVLVDGAAVSKPTTLCNVVFQQHSLFPWMTALRNVSFGPEMQGHPEPVRFAEQLLELVGLARFKHAYPAALSGGMQQRVAIARALSTNPTILLMDEPFGALDAQTRTRMQAELLRVWSQYRKTVIFITHDIDEAIYLADRTVVLGADGGAVLDDIAIDLPRDRGPDIMHTREFIAIRERAARALHAQPAAVSLEAA